MNYTAVNHGLDEEEIAFKQSLEAQNGDDIDELFNFSGQDELEFDTNDLDNLEMLQVRLAVTIRGCLSRCLQLTTPGVHPRGLLRFNARKRHGIVPSV